MCDQRPWELLDVDEYFMKYIRISPILTYAEDELNIKKLDFQTILLSKLENREIDKDSLQKIYKSYIVVDKELGRELSSLIFHFQEKIKQAEQKKEQELIMFLNSAINNLSM